MDAKEIKNGDQMKADLIALFAPIREYIETHGISSASLPFKADSSRREDDFGFDRRPLPDNIRPILWHFGGIYVLDEQEGPECREIYRLRAEIESLKADAVRWDAWRERVAAEFFQSDQFGMNDIWIAISALIRQRDEAQRSWGEEVEESQRRLVRIEALLRSVDDTRDLYLSQVAYSNKLNSELSRICAELYLVTARAEAAEKKCEAMEGEHQRRRLLIAALDQNIASLRKTGESLAGKLVAAEKERDEAVQSFRTAIELDGVQKYATLLDERDALAVRLEATERTRDEALSRLKASLMRSISRTTETLKLNQQNAAMREALKPFAFENPGAMGSARVEVHVTAADTRRALAALKPDPAPEPIIPPSC